MLPVVGWDSAKLVQKFLYVPNSFLITLWSARQNCVSLKTYVCIHSGSSMQKGNLDAKWQIGKAYLFSDVSVLPGPQSRGLMPSLQRNQRQGQRGGGIWQIRKWWNYLMYGHTLKQVSLAGIFPLNSKQNPLGFCLSASGWIAHVPNTALDHWAQFLWYFLFQCNFHTNVGCISKSWVAEARTW